VRRIVLFFAVLGMMALTFLLAVPYGPHRETFVEIAPGTSSLQIAQELEFLGVIRSRYGFDFWRLAAVGLSKGGTLKAGEYRFDHPARVAEIYDRIRQGDVFTIAVTIPEGSNIFDIAARVEGAQLGTKEAFERAAMHDSALVADLDPNAASLEGYLFPDTYQFGRRATAGEMLTAMVKRFRSAATLS